MSRWLLLPVSICLLAVAGLPLVSQARATAAKSRIVKLWDGKVRLTLPRLAGNPVQVSEKLFYVRPPDDLPELKYVIFVAREPLRPDEIVQSNKALSESFKKMLQGLGYEVIKMVNTGNTFVADFRAVMEPGVLPWQKLGPGVARGTAKFVRTGNELSGSILLCDPPQWKDKTTQAFRNVVGGTLVSKK